KEGLVVMDAEYCGITFGVSQFSAVRFKDILASAVNAKAYVDIADEDLDEDIVIELDDQSLEVMILANGVILATEYRPLTQKQFYLSGKNTKDSVLFSVLEADQKIPFARLGGSGVEFMEIEGFEKVVDGEVVSWNFRTLQVISRVVATPPHLKTAPLFGRDKEFWKESSKIFGALMGVMLLLLLVDTSVEPPEEKQVAVIYRKAVKSKDVSQTKTAENPNKVDKDEGVKEKEYEKKEVQTAKAAAPQ